jgi:hypothetical protein
MPFWRQEVTGSGSHIPSISALFC